MEQSELLAFVLSKLDELNVEYMVVGSFASSSYGEPRLTNDIDIVIQIEARQVALLATAFPMSDFYLSEDAAREAVRAHGQFNVIHPTSGNKIDFMLSPPTAWGAEQMRRRRRRNFFVDCAGFIASPEDIALAKMMYYREGGSEKHLRDITGMMTRLGAAFDRTYTEKWANSLDVVEVWQAVLARLA